MSLPMTEIPLDEIPTARTTSSRRRDFEYQRSTANLTSQRSSFSTPRNNGSPVRSRSRAREPDPVKPGGRRHLQKQPSKIAKDADKTHLNSVGRFYESLLARSTWKRYSFYIVPLALIIAIPIIIGATVASSAKIGGVRMVWFFTWLESVWLSLWIMRLVAKLLPYVFSYFAGVVSSSTKKYARVLINMETMITILGWVIVSFVLYEVLFSTSAAGNTPLGWTKQFKQVMGAILVSAIVFAIEKLLIQLLSISYHARSFNLKIDEAKRAVYLLSLLFDASRTLFPMYGKEFAEEDYVISMNIEAFIRKGAVGSGDPGNAEKRHTRVLRGIGKLSDRVNSVFGNIATELTGSKVLPPKSAHSIVVESLEKRRSAEALASRLWYSFVLEGHDSLTVGDLEEVLGDNRLETARECFSMLDPDNNGNITLEEMILKIKKICTDRKAIARSMHDVSQAITALDNVAGAVAFLISIFVLVSFLDTGFSSILSTASTALLSLSFVFSVTAQEFLGSCIFLFIKHPYDISDQVNINGPGGINRLVVEQIALFYTAFKRLDDLEMIQVPNNVLNTLWINNITRSKGLLEKLDVFIDFDTPLEDIEALRVEMEDFVRTPENSRDFQPDIVVYTIGVGTIDQQQLKIEVRHKSNWGVDGIRAARHSKLICALVIALRRIPIKGPGGHAEPLGDPSNPKYTVMVTDEMAGKMKEKHAKQSDAARLHPMLPREEKAEAELEREQAAADALNARSYLDDERLREQDRENDLVNIVGEQIPERLSTVREEIAIGRGNSVASYASGLGRRFTTRDGRSGSLLGLQKTQSGRGRRMPGQSAPGPSLEEVQSRTSVRSGQQGQGLERSGTRLSRVESSESGEESVRLKGDWDQEAQIGR